MIDQQAASGPAPESEDRAARVAELRRRVRAGEYRIDPDAVAGALLQRLRSIGTGRQAGNEDRQTPEAQAAARLIAA